MPRFSEETQAEIFDAIAPESGLADKIRACWCGLQRVEVYRFEKDPKTKKHKEEILGTVLPIGDEEDDFALPEAGQDPVDDVNEFIRWIVSLGVEEAGARERRVTCRCRIYFRPKPEMEADKTAYAKFEAPTPEELEEDDLEEEEEEDEPPRRGPRLPFRDPRHGPMGIGLGMGMFENQLREARQREDQLRGELNRQFGDAMEYLRDRTAAIDVREERVVSVLETTIDRLQTQVSSLTAKQNQMVDATIGGRRAELEARRDAQQSLTDAIRMQFNVLEQRGEIAEQSAERRVEEANKGSRHRLMESLLVPVITALPGMLTSIAAIWKGQQPPPQAAPQPYRPAATPPAPAATYARPRPQTPPTPSAGRPAASAPSNPIATGKPFAGSFVRCNEVLASLSQEQKDTLSSKLDESTHTALMAWLGAEADVNCVAGLVAFQQVGGQPAYEVLGEVLDDAQSNKLEKVVNTILASQPTPPAEGAVIDAEARG